MTERVDMRILSVYGYDEWIVQCSCGCRFLATCYGSDGRATNMRQVDGVECPVCPSCHRTAAPGWESSNPKS